MRGIVAKILRKKALVISEITGQKNQMTINFKTFRGTLRLQGARRIYQDLKKSYLGMSGGIKA